MVISGELKVWRLLIYDHMFTFIHQGTLLMVQRFYKTLYFQLGVFRYYVHFTIKHMFSSCGDISPHTYRVNANETQAKK